LLDSGVGLFAFRGESGLIFDGGGVNKVVAFGALVGWEFSFVFGGPTSVSGVLRVLKDGEERCFIIWRLLSTASSRRLMEADDMVVVSVKHFDRRGSFEFCEGKANGLWTGAEAFTSLINCS
jgi:hypothetical protein